MDDHTLAPVGDADDAFARHRLAAFRALEGLVSRQAHDRALGVDLFGDGLRQFGIKRLDHPARRQFSGAKPRQKIVFVRQAEHLCRCPQGLVGGLLAHMVERRARKFHTQLDETAPVLFAQ